MTLNGRLARLERRITMEHVSHLNAFLEALRAFGRPWAGRVEGLDAEELARLHRDLAALYRLGTERPEDAPGG